MQQRRRAAFTAALLFLALPAGAVVPLTRIETAISPSTTSLYVPPQSPEAVQVVWPVTITPKAGGATDGSVESHAGSLREFFGPGLLQYHLATAYIRGVARAEFGVLRAFAFAGGGVSPKGWGLPFVIATNPYGAFARVVMRPQFIDGFTSPATPGAPNAGDAQVLTGQVQLHGGIGGQDPKVTWLIRLHIYTDTTPAQSVFFSSFATDTCGGPCPFPLDTFPVEFTTTVGTTYVIDGDVAATAIAGGNGNSIDDGYNMGAIDVASTGAFFIRVKETGNGVVGLSGRDYGAAVPPSDLVIPTTSTIKLPPDSTTSTTTTIVTTSTIDPGGTTTTSSLPPPVERCDNCVDDDADGLVDAEDPGCCSGAPLALAMRKAKLVPGGTGTALQLVATTTAGLDPTVGGLTVQLRDPSAGALLCAHLPATGFARKKKGKLLAYKDAAGAIRGITAASLRAGKSDVTLALGGKRVQLDAALGSVLEMTVAVAEASGRRCGSTPASPLRATGKKGTLKYP